MRTTQDQTLDLSDYPLVGYFAGVPVAEVPLPAGTRELSVLATPSLDLLLSDALDLERPPYWPVFWRSAFGLTQWLVRQPPQVGLPILELGCGGGWCGLVAAERGARVVQTDYIPAALALAQENAWRNGVRGIRRFVADWRAWPLRAPFPLVIGSDISYERSVHAALQTVLEAAVAPGGTVLLADPGRPVSLEFAARLETAGWHIELETLDSSTQAPLYLYRASPPQR